MNVDLHKRLPAMTRVARVERITRNSSTHTLGQVATALAAGHDYDTGTCGDVMAELWTRAYYATRYRWHRAQARHPGSQV